MIGHLVSPKGTLKCPNVSADARRVVSTKRTRKTARSTRPKILKNALKYNDIHRDKLLISLTIINAQLDLLKTSLNGNCCTHDNLLDLCNAYILIDYDRKHRPNIFFK